MENAQGAKGRDEAEEDDDEAWLYCGSRLRKGEVFAYVGRNQNLKDLKDDDDSEDVPERTADAMSKWTVLSGPLWG